MKNYTHLTLQERKMIEQSLIRGDSLKFIAKELGRSTSTISREIHKNARAKRIGSLGGPFNNCLHRASCLEYRLCDKEDCKRRSCRGCSLCFKLCEHYQREDCTLLKSPPYACNGCKNRSRCTLEKFLYRAKEAHASYEHTLKESRNGLSITCEELARLDSIISPLIIKGHSPHVICTNNKDLIMRDEKTIYKYVNAGIFSAKNLDLQRKVKFRPRKKKAKLKVEKSCRKGKSYTDFVKFMDEHPDTAIVQMDTVEGKKADAEPVLLTLHFTSSQLMLAFLRPANTARSVTEVFSHLWQVLGHELFGCLFPLILTDNGSEFSNPSAIEFAPDGTRRTRIFFCDPSAPYQKGAIENNHSLIRRVLPKGTSFKKFSQDDINLLMSHINSYSRKKLNDRPPHQVFSFFHPNILHRLGVNLIDDNEIILTPDLLRR